MSSEDYEPKWIAHFNKGEYFAALENTILFGGASQAQMIALSALLVAQAIGHLPWELRK